jgi:hypothetical protein
LVPFPFPFARLNALQAAVRHSNNVQGSEYTFVQSDILTTSKVLNTLLCNTILCIANTLLCIANIQTIVITAVLHTFRDPTSAAASVSVAVGAAVAAVAATADTVVAVALAAATAAAVAANVISSAISAYHYLIDCCLFAPPLPAPAPTIAPRPSAAVAVAAATTATGHSCCRRRHSHHLRFLCNC